MSTFWEIMSDKGLLERLADDQGFIVDGEIKLIISQLLFRIQALETQCLALQSLLCEQGITDIEQLPQVSRTAEGYLKDKDLKKYREIATLSATGIEPLEWLRYAYTGKFSN